MSEKKPKTVDPLLKNEQGLKQSDQPEKPAKAEVGSEQPAPRVLTPLAQIKADAVAKFPKDVTAQTGYILHNSEHVNFIVPQLEGETDEEEVQINGFKMTVKKNEMVSIPVQVASLLAEKYRINMEAGKDVRADRTTKISDALN